MRLVFYHALVLFKYNSLVRVKVPAGKDTTYNFLRKVKTNYLELNVCSYVIRDLMIMNC